MYYILHYNTPEDEEGGYPDINDGLQFDGFKSWSLGRHFDASLPNPIIVNFMPVDGYQGPPADMYNESMCLMRTRMVKVLEEEGVTNLDTYPAVLKNEETGETYDYRAVNIIGLLSAADLSKSKWESYDGDALYDVNFDSLEIDKDAARGLLIFRLAENSLTIVVHEKIRNRLVKEDFPTLNFVEPKDWVT